VTDVETELSSADESEGELVENKEKERLESLKKLQGPLEGTSYSWLTECWVDDRWSWEREGSVQDRTGIFEDE
jgi:hypothetical protein